jgi:sorbitol/mannitol transport system permease protein
VVILIQTIFLLGVYAEILVTTRRRAGLCIHQPALPHLQGRSVGGDVGRASAGGVIAVILANIVAIFLMRAVGKNLDK